MMTKFPSEAGLEYVYFVSYSIMTKKGDHGFGRAQITGDRPITLMEQIEVIEKNIAENNTFSDGSVPGISVLWFNLLHTRKGT